MSRRPRIQVPGGTYYLVQFTSRRQPLFENASDYTHLEHLLAGTIRRTRAKVFAFCWLPHELHLAVQMNDATPGRFMQGFTSRYAQYVHRHTDDRGHLFAQRFSSLLIDPEVWLPQLVRYIHYAAVGGGESSFPSYAHSSHHIYTGNRSPSWLDTDTVLRLLHQRGIATTAQQISYFNADPTTEELRLFGNGKRHTRILGDSTFRQRLPRAHRPVTSGLTLSRLIDIIAISQSTSREEILSLSRRRTAALARALIAWHATERRIATLSEVAQLLRRDPSTLSKAISRHRNTYPGLFRLDAFTHLSSLGK